ncbi:hypothetical protein [Paeniglutamicibacter psychrophenolicus]|uniref:hypothetical protein n=1 Tax=Paeniglutamicibacter psychrophenolicus TaxID=257454 RepID=UPI002782A816|nr:hypothetical protein [Paeniglutamicibacter psychrophenolicus]MDQ0095900.1 hypothetical protein [Paeniglutamicibacter psychrophenolicus]
MDKDPGFPQDLQRENDSTLADVVDSDQDRQGRIGRRAILGLTALFILASLSGVFGLNSVATSSSPGYELTVKSPGSTRAGMDARITVELHATEKITGTVIVEVDQNYLDSFTSYGISPAPDGEGSDGDVVSLEFDPPGETGFRVDIDGTSSEDMVVLSTGRLRVYVGGELAGTVDLKTWKAF